MKLSVTCWSFPMLTLGEVAGVARALGFEAIDLGYFYASALDRRRLLAEPERLAEELRERLGIGIANLYHLFGADLMERNLALGPDPANLGDLRAALRFARAAGAPSVFILPGMVNPGQSRAQALAAAAESLKPLVEAGAAAGIAVAVEPHVHGLLESPAMTEDLLARVPGLRIVLDPAHFVAMGARQEEIEPLCRHAAHVHLRQARPGVLQAKLDQGTIGFPAFLGALREAGYGGWLAVEYVHQRYMDTLHDDVLTETVKMRDLVRGWAGATAR